MMSSPKHCTALTCFVERCRFLPGFDISRLNEVLDAQAFLASVPMLEHLEKSQLRRVEEAMQLMVFAQDEYVMRQGDVGANEMCILSLDQLFVTFSSLKFQQSSWPRLLKSAPT
eukprot:COSAG05_NODE_3548_length_1998_cov_1.643497_1_plen_114_part_00